MTTVTFDHEKLDAYSAALEFVVVAHDVIREFPKGRASLGDQLERAATSVVLNIAEGSGEFSSKEKARFYRMALRSAAECGAVLDVARRIEIVSPRHEQRGRELLARLAAMITGLVRRHQE